ncbi:MAG: phosphoribosylaminoimidazolesuccinocarboxamide synthase [Ignavibacteria bacterium GWA2_55_11]|nr:MAG: phosphoribosylaminoimidazolesuccinocarboxamide synthase [Ignavibacteria bacterium GWA2_55_11]OGU45709.1 MAG: phosphoribosylaminoimidazolesuccinocarboxamide synthase [Ignavibacteria bacterium GWC2_56_12]OGU66271.1 MAG: phosphoribosylaminoimidazolesuccinocarboxamide synthase [Ignavibacteria bacterium RIFCSPHIGHO2_02_FULL_56_12]OGU70075.1 MAG: phosphoribosylaminoimidazolesuccinocarboxamide synthase [Ignavibacteria bacterium RIFCSPLOWO2_02_FULL_55_14]OGU72080.1 MAG: phosphoribosylaminoimida
MAATLNIPVVTKTSFRGLKFLHSGKVRDIYEVDGGLLIVATDRLSAYDVIMNEGIPFKGKVLTIVSEYWFGRMADIVPHHLLSSIVYDFPSSCKPFWREMEDRTMYVRKTRPLPIECVVRGYLSGSGWQEYRTQGTVCGIRLPGGLVESDRLPEPIFTPATKEQQGKHDENISFDRVVEIVGADVAEQVRTFALAIYARAAAEAETKGIIIADTKMEFGMDDDGKIVLIDELLTPDSSRFWPKDKYQPGRGQDSFDKQFVRDYLNSVNFNRQPPPPKLPEHIIFKTSALYLEALKRLTAREVF